MKRIGLIVFVVGLLLTVLKVSDFVVKEKVVDVGPIEITRDKKLDFQWSPILGVIVMVIGGGLYFYGKKKRL